MGISDEVKLALEFGGFAVTAATVVIPVLWRMSALTTSFTLIGEQQAKEITEIKLAIVEMKAVVTAVAVQKERLDAMAQRANLLEQRVDERLNHISGELADLRRGRGYINDQTR